MQALRVSGLALVLLTALCSCSAHSPQAEAAGRTAEAFASASASSPQAACAMLAPQSRQELEQSSGSCPRGITQAGVHPGGTVLDVQVYGLDAMVQMDHDTMFLALFHSGWRVTAAGCTPQQKDRPYSCQIKGA